MALEVEDGTGKADANSYVSVAEYRAYAQARGVSLPVADAQVEVQLIQAMDYVESFRAKYQGRKTWPRPGMDVSHPDAQALQWPRTGVTIDCGYNLPDNVIPQELKQVQMQAALEVNTGLSLMPSSDGRVVKKEKVDVIETEYMTADETGNDRVGVPSFPLLEALLEPLFNACGGFFLRTRRA
jgi:hypothetical protein